MPWNPDAQKIDLLIENHGTAKQPRYKLQGMIRRTTREGQSYLEPLPHAWAFKLLEFTKIEVIPPTSTKRGADAGELSLTRQSNSERFQGRKA